MLVGSFSRGLFLVGVWRQAASAQNICLFHSYAMIYSVLISYIKLEQGCIRSSYLQVHSECEESQYINSRPFRVNAGPVSRPRPVICT